MANLFKNSHCVAFHFHGSLLTKRTEPRNIYDYASYFFSRVSEKITVGNGSEALFVDAKHTLKLT